MTYRLGFVGHVNTYAYVAKVVQEYFNDMELYHAEFSSDDDIEQAVQRVAAVMEHCDGLLYSRYAPYLLISRYLNHSIPTRYAPTDSSHLITSLLQGAVSYGLPFTSLSVDSFTLPQVQSALASVGVDPSTVEINIVTADVFAPGFIQSLLDSHLENARHGVRLCVTHATRVRDSLAEQGFAAVSISPSTEAFTREIRNLMLRSPQPDSQQDSVAVLSLSISFKERYKFYQELPLRRIDEYAAIEKRVYLYGDKLDASVFTLDRGAYRLICDSAFLRAQSGDFTDIPIMELIDSNTSFQAAIGIGIGRTHHEAQSRSMTALTRAQQQRNSSVFIAPDGQRLLGPLTSRSAQLEQESQVDERLLAVAESCGLSFDAVHKLYQSSRLRSGTLYTSDEIAEILGVSRRAANNAIQRLLDNNNAVIVGKSLRSPKGRPFRVLKLNL